MKRLLVFSLIAIFILTLGGTAMAQGPEDVDALQGLGWWTSISIQNPASSGTANFSMEAKNISGGGSSAEGCSVGAGASVIYNPNLAPNIGTGGTRIGFDNDCGVGGGDQLASNFEGGVTVSSDAPLVAVVSVGNNKAGSGGVDGGTASAFYQGFDGAKTATSLSFPVAKNAFFGQTTTFYIQAVEDASVTLTYGTGETDGPHAILAGETRVFSPDDASVPDSTNTSAVAASTTGRIAGAVVEHEDTVSNNAATFALSTRAFVASEASDTVYIPSVKNDFFGGTTGVAVQAVGGQVTVEFDFAITNAATGATCTASTSAAVTINDGANDIWGGGADKNLPTGFGNGCFGSATARVTAGTGKIVATVNETSGSGKAVYSAFGKEAASQTVAVPLVKEEFFNGRTAVVVQAVGDSATTTNVTATYVNGGTCSSGCAVTPAGGGAGDANLPGGSANNFRRINNFSDQYSGTFPETSTNNAVVISSSALPVVAVAQETVTGLDVKNYEGFPQ